MKSTRIVQIFMALILTLIIYSCNDTQQKKKNITTKSSEKLIENQPDTIPTPEGMVWVQGKTFVQGAKQGDTYAMPRERPARQVQVDGFFIDATEVTNAQFAKFVEETNYITIAEQPIDWEEMKKELPPGTPKPHDSILRPGSLIFNDQVNAVVSMENYGQWWTWKTGADWKHPKGPESSIEGLDNYPVVHIAYKDALAYCKWANRSLPTEAQWESAAQGTQQNAIYTWGNNPEVLSKSANTWEGQFPVNNTAEDGHFSYAAVKSYPPNNIGIYDMLGNVWEWTRDIYNANYYTETNISGTIKNPTGATTYYNPQNPYQVEMVMKGGSYLCHKSYCASYRISARMSTSKDSGSDHLGFRTVMNVSE